MTSLTRYKSSSTAPHLKWDKLRILKNVFIMCLGVLMLFTAYDGLSFLQSTMNSEGGIGVISQAVIYVSFCLSSILFPKYITIKLGTKLTFVLSMISYIPYIASNFYPHWIVMMPASILIGLAAPMLWGSQSIYLNDISRLYVDVLLSSKSKTKISPRIKSDESKDSKSITSHVSNEKPSALCIRTSSVGWDYTKEDIRTLEVGDSCYATWHSCPGTNGNTQPDARSAFTMTDESVILSKSQPTTPTVKYKTMSFSNSPEKIIYPSSLQVCTIDPISSYVISDRFIAPPINTEKLAESPEEVKVRYKLTESIVARFFGLHGLSYLTCHLWSNLMSYYILMKEVRPGINNVTCSCGPEFCNSEPACLEGMDIPSNETRYLLTGVGVGIALLSVAVVQLFLDPLDTEKEEAHFSFEFLMATCRLAKRKEIIFLAPISYYIGMAQSFFMGDFTKAYVSCAWGTYHVGLVAVCYGAFCGASSLLSGWLVKMWGRMPLFFTVTVVNIAAIVFLLHWNPDPHNPAKFFLAAGMWGIYCGTVWSQLRGFYGLLFKADEEAAFAAYHVSYSLGFGVSFAYSNYLCTFVKLYALTAVCCLGFIGYVFAERTGRRNKDEG